MKKKLFSIIIMFFSIFIYSQEEDNELFSFNSPSTGKVGYMNSKDEIIIPAIYSSGSSSEKHNLYIVTKGARNSTEERYALYDNKGNIIIGFENNYEFIGLSDFDEGIILVEKNGKYGYVNKKNEIKISIIYDDLGQIRDGLMPAQRNEKYGYIDLQENVIIDFQFERAFAFSGEQSDNHKYAEISINEKYGYINEKGEIIIPCIYDLCYSFYNDIAEVEINKKRGVINIRGEVIIPIIYDNISTENELGQIIATMELKPKYEFVYNKDGFIKKRKIGDN